MKNNKFSGILSLIIVAALMFAVVYGVRVTETGSPASGGAASGGTNAASSAADGTYESTAKGFKSDIKVTMTIKDGVITDVQAEGDETDGLGSVAIDKLPSEIINQQSANVDGVSGATVSSNAILSAAAEVLKEAGWIEGEDAASSDSASAESEQPKLDETVDVDLVVVGAGGAGMTAAINAKQEGLDVVLVEKMPYVGGNTLKATGGMNAAETHYQEEQAIEDSVDQFVEDTIEGGHQLNDPALVRKMAEESAGAIEWLDSIGAPLPKVSFSGGAANARIHSPEDGSGVGEFLVKHFREKVEELNIPVYLETTATKILMDGEKAVGVKAESKDTNYTFNAKAVILATGGFGGNQDMICEYRPDLAGTVSTSAPGITGDGIRMAEEVGAATVDMDQIQLHPTVEQETSMLITEGVRGDGAILVNKDGKRFINEMETRDVVSAAELKQDGQYAYVIFDQGIRDILAAIEKYVSNGIVTEGKTIEDLAKKIDIDPATLKKTVEDWNQYVEDQNDPDFGRSTAMERALDTPPYYAIKIAPGIHHTMGGIKIDTDAKVISTDGKPIPGLFACGEVTGGVHGGNRLGGNAVADIVVFGRIAAQSVDAYIDGDQNPAASETEVSETEAVETKAESDTEKTTEASAESAAEESASEDAEAETEVKAEEETEAKADKKKSSKKETEAKAEKKSSKKDTEAEAEKNTKKDSETKKDTKKSNPLLPIKNSILQSVKFLKCVDFSKYSPTFL